MNQRVNPEPRGSEILRAIAFASAIILFLHAAAFPILWGFGSFFVFGVSDEWNLAHRILMFTGLITLATFSVSTQFYLASKRTRD